MALLQGRETKLATKALFGMIIDQSKEKDPQQMLLELFSTIKGASHPPWHCIWKKEDEIDLTDSKIFW